MRHRCLQSSTRGVGEPSGKVVGVDIDERLLEVAKKRTVETGYSNLMEFRKGDACNLPLDNNFADLSFCHALLWVLESPVNALREMARVVKPERLVAASESDEGFSMHYDREDERYTKLANIYAKAAARGVRKLYKSDLYIGRKLPSLFRQAGLTDISPYGSLRLNLRSELQERTLEQAVEVYKWQLESLTAKDPSIRKRRQQGIRARLAGGMSRAGI